LTLNSKWDISLNSNGDIATTSGLYCDAQNVANAIRLFTRDAFLAQDKGVPHFALELGKMPPLSSVRNAYRKRGKEVENISDIQVDSLGVDIDTRRLTGRIILTNEDGNQASVTL
jgi:hypothetical protein